MRHLAQSIVLEESGTSALVRAALGVSSAAILLFVGWAALTHVEEVAVTLGQVVPSGQVQAVQHLEGGIVSEILVQEGELVDVGQPLIRLNPAQTQGDYDQNKARMVALELRAERLRAFVEGREPNFSFVGPGFDSLVKDQTAIYQVQKQAREAGRAVIQAQIEQRRSDMRLYEEQLKAISEQLRIVTEELNMRGELLAKGLVSKVLYLETQRQMAQIQGEKARVLGQMRTASEALGEAQKKLNENEASLHKQAMDEMGLTTAELAQVRESMARMQDKVTRLDVKAPVRGLVQGMKVVNPGAVVQPGGLVAQIVPVDNEMQVETRITTRDIGHIGVGQPVTVKVNTYDFSRYGSVKGTLIGVSPTTFMDEQNQPYYKGLVSLQKNYVGNDPAHNRVLPGMTVQADIITGDKTLLQYLLKPIYSSMHQAFHER